MFLLLTVSAQALLLSRSGTASWRDLLLIPHPVYLIFALLSTVGEALLAGARLAVFNRILPRRVSFLACVRANLCAVFAMTLTPGGVGGGPMQMFVLTRAGMPLGDAAMLSVASFFTTLLALAAGGAAAALFGGTAALEHSPALAGLFRATGLFCLLAGGALIVLLWKPDLPPALLYRVFRLLPGRAAGRGPTRPFRQAVRALVAARKTAGRYLRHGRGAFLAALLIAAAILANNCLQAYWLVRALGADPPFSVVAGIQIPSILLATYSPSPGGSGVAEIGAALLMGAILPAARLPLYVLLWRTVVFYLLAAAGGVLLAMTLRKKKD